MIEQVLKSKFLGALIGTGIGDALGAPFEGWSKVKLGKQKPWSELTEKEKKIRISIIAGLAILVVAAVVVFFLV